MLDKLLDIAESIHGDKIRPIAQTIELFPDEKEYGIYRCLWYNDNIGSTHIAKIQQ